MTTLERNGFELVARCTESICGVPEATIFKVHANIGRAGTRNLLTESAAVRQVADEITRLEVVGAATSHPAFPVRAILFDKTPRTNWNVSWHQDSTIAVAERHEVPGFSGWTMKQGVWHVQPPLAILERMITLRLHLDDCNSDNGPLRVIPGSHRDGRLNSEAIAHWRSVVPEKEIICQAGDALLMRPLLLHAPSKANRPSHRRVLHVEYAAFQLPSPLAWAFASTESMKMD